jgi:hypothetical protein
MTAAVFRLDPLAGPRGTCALIRCAAVMIAAGR